MEERKQRKEFTLVSCVNAGCGKSYDPADNPADACSYHPGEPFFHDAYKGWACCNKKVTDFTDFLNIPGCTISKHNNVRHIEKPKPQPDTQPSKVIINSPAPITIMERPPFDTPMTRLTPHVAESLKNKKDTISQSTEKIHCLHRGCREEYTSDESFSPMCCYHTGHPVFHEGMKYWTCCQKRTTDFTAFLTQTGCEIGKHLWSDGKENWKTIDCRWDWHQTANFAVLTIYAKDYCPTKSFIEINPIRVRVNIGFTGDKRLFKLDLELSGVIDVEHSEAYMQNVKIEIKLKKVAAGSWSKFHLPRTDDVQEVKESVDCVDELTPQVEAVDLSDL